MMRLIDPGAMREIVSLQAATRTADDSGGYTEEWEDVDAMSDKFAEIEPLTGREQISALQTEARGTHRVRMWAIEGVKSTTHRIRRHRDDGIMEIVAPPSYDPTRLQMELLCEELEVAE